MIFADSLYCHPERSEGTHAFCPAQAETHGFFASLKNDKLE
jgi:hypothetical protein